MMTILAFVTALALLIAIHEYGHYRVAVACGVKVLKFSIGLGKTIFKWQPKGSDTEFVIGMLPLGGFVKMLDEREAPVPVDQKHSTRSHCANEPPSLLLDPLPIWFWRFSCIQS
jgi:regulator of sigma E protease